MSELARVKRIGKSNIDQASCAKCRRLLPDVLRWRNENLDLRAQNAELLAALRECELTIDLRVERKTPLIARILLDVRAILAKYKTRPI